MLNFRLLIVSICIVVALILYLFFWNRVIGWLIGRSIRLLFWSQGQSSVWLDVGSIHFSLLSGRILVKDVRYHSSNQTIRVVKGQVSWRYWIRAPAGDTDLSHARVLGEDVGVNLKKAPLSCRLHITLQGLEWFIYNRTAAYDGIVTAMQTSTESASATPEARASADGVGSLRKIFSWTSVVPESTNLGPPISLVSSIYSRTPAVLKNSLARLKRQLPNLDPKDLLPLGIEIHKGAFIIGNASTPSLLVAEFRSAEGTYGIVPSRSKFDLYKQMVNLQFQDATMRYVDNSRKRNPMVQNGARLHQTIQTSNPRPLRSFSYLSYPAFVKLWRRFKLWHAVADSADSSSTHDIPAPSWSRRRHMKDLDDETPLGADFSTLEYAKERRIIEAPVLELLYYADSVGCVPSNAEPAHLDDPFEIGNSDLPPEWGIDIAIRGGIIKYGPWADRQRVVLQQSFFPPNFCDAVPFTRLKPGDARVWPCMKIFIELKDGVTLTIPFREASKNWQWDGEVHIPNRPRKREAASFHVRAGDNSTISYMLPMVATHRGYEPNVNVHLDTVSITSSLNDIRLLRADSCVIRCETPSPLRWNAQRCWSFTISLRTPVVYILRDHINMFTDLGKDWSSGPLGDHNRFIPIVYKLAVDMQNYDIKTYVNDHNIIDKPLIPEENALLSLHGSHLQNDVTVPFVKYRPEATTISFGVEASSVGVSLALPRWNTRSLYSKPHRSSDVGLIGLLRLQASYCFHSDVHLDNVDHLKLQFLMKEVVYKACGWTMRHFMILRNNYFGSFTHFSTLYEYLEKRRLQQPLGDPVDLQYREGTSNALQVQLGVVVDHGLIIMPAGLRGYENDQVNDDKTNTEIGTSAILSFPDLQVQLRTHDYYMEMSLNTGAISASTLSRCSEDLATAWSASRNAEDTLIVDGLDVNAHRLFGPLPRTSTYLCIWEIHVGRIMGHITALDARTFAAAGRAFGLSFTDPLNAPAAEYEVPSDPDVNFLKLQVAQMNVIWHADNAAVEVAIREGIRLDRNDVAGALYSKITSVRVPHTSFKLLLQSEIDKEEWLEAMNIQGDFNVDWYTAPIGWQGKAKAQMSFLAAQDSHTGRAMFLYMPDQSLPYDTISPGRGLLDTNHYLPQIRIPSPVGIRGTTKSLPPKATAYAPSPAAIPRHLAHQPESDGDEYVSEADRDARLAKSRPQTQVSHNPEYEDMFSGDESDNEDLTESYHTDTDVEEPARASRWPPSSDYSAYVACYTARFLRNPTYWQHSPFRLKRESSLPPEPATPDIPQSDAEAHPDEDHASTAPITSLVRVGSSSGLYVQLTPLVLPVVEALRLDITRQQLSTELRFEKIMLDHLDSCMQNNDPSEGSTILDVGLSSVRIRLVQLIDRSAYPSVETATSQDLMPSSLDFVLQGARFKTRKTIGESSGSNRRSATASFHHLSMGLVSNDQTTLAWQFAVGPSRFNLSDWCVSATIGKTYMEVLHTAPEQAMPTALALLRCARELQEAASEFSRTRTTLDLQTVHIAIKHASGRTVVDPLSTIQPSFLVQKGRPQRLRTDIGFKYLVYLRNYMQSLNSADWAKRVTEEWDPTESPGVLSRLLEDHILQFSAEPTLPLFPPRSPFAKFLHSQSHSEGHESSAYLPHRFSTLTTKLDQLHLVCRWQDEMCSELSIGGLTFSGRIRSAGWYQPHISGPAKSATTISIREKGRQEVIHVSAILSLDHIALSVRPQLMQLAQVLVRTMKPYNMEAIGNRSSSRSPSRSCTSDTTTRPVIYGDIALVTKSIRLEAAAENLIIEYQALDVGITSSALFKPPTVSRQSWDSSMNHSILASEIKLQACTASDSSNPGEYAVLAAIISRTIRINAVFKRDADSSLALRSVFTMDLLHVNVPRSALRLFRFVEEWKADYLPGLNATIQDLLLELHGNAGQTTQSASTQTPKASAFIACHIEARISAFRVSLQIMRGTWIAWELSRNISYLTFSETTSSRKSWAFGLQIHHQTIVISSKENTSDLKPNIRMKLPLPSFSVTGRYGKKRVDGLALVEAFHATIKPSHWDTLLTVQQKFGQDFNDLVSLVQKTQNDTAPSKAQSAQLSWKYSVVGRMKGFRIGLEGGSSTVFLECEHIGGTISNDVVRKWHIELSDLALSLAPRALIPRQTQTFRRGHRSAFVIIDMRVEMAAHGHHKAQTLKLLVSKVHAVMQPSSIGELGDFVDHLQSEMLSRKEKRAQDMAEFKEKTKNLLKTFEITTGTSQAEPLSWIDAYLLQIAVSNIGVAFPLAINQELRLPKSGAREPGAVRAFLLSVRSVTFDTQRGESGQASMKAFSFLFVHRFRQSVPSDFSGDSHPSRNKLLYPDMTAQLRVVRTSSSRQLHVAASVDGFILDIDSSIPDYVTSLIEVYRHGKDRVGRFAGAPRSAVQTLEPSKTEARSDSQPQTHLQDMLTSNIFISLAFRSGRVRMFSQAYTANVSRNRSISTPTQEPSDSDLRELGADVFDLPMVTVWGEYRATPAFNKLVGKRVQTEPSTLLFKSTIHSSQNTLRPTLLPFITEVVNNVEDRLRQASRQDSRSLPLPSPRVVEHSLQDEQYNRASDSVSSMQITLSLRIDQSKLELTCQPDVNVIAGLNWDSGGFLINISPGAHRVTFSGSVGGLTVGLKHGFLSEDCMRLHAQNLAFTVDFAKSRNSSVSSISIVCDTEFSGSMRFSRLQDVLCFKAVWLDRIPIFTAPVPPTGPATPSAIGSRSISSVTTASSSTSKQELTTVLVLRLRQVRLDVDLGQSISSIQLSLHDAIFRTKFADMVSEVSLSVHQVSVVSSGNITGRITVPDFLFQTVRRERNSLDSIGSRMLDLQMTSGPLDIDLDSEFQKLILYRAEPLDIRIYDDWSQFGDSNIPGDRKVRLTFTVKGSDITAVMSVGTIPKLFGYGGKFKANLDAQKEGARRESKAFRLSNSPKPDNPLSDVANAMFLSARSRLLEETGFTCVIGQRLSLRLKKLRLVIFPRSMRDPELAQFIGSDVHARLDRVVESETLPPERDLQLSFRTISISKLSQLNYSLPPDNVPLSSVEWLNRLTQNAAEAIIFSLPSMIMRMHSEECSEDGSRILPYDFSSRFSDAEGVKEEDIFITLNMSLYSWLTLLRKTFAREMEQVQASADARASSLGVVAQPAARKGKVSEPSPLEIEKDKDRITDLPNIVTSGRAPLPHTRSTPVGRSSTSSTTDWNTSPPVIQILASNAKPTKPRVTSSPTEEIPPRSPSPGLPANKKAAGLTYRPRQRVIERLTMRQLGEATPDVMHPFFMKTSGFSLEDSLPQYVHEYATMPTEEIMKALLKLYSKQLKVDTMPLK